MYGPCVGIGGAISSWTVVSCVAPSAVPSSSSSVSEGRKENLERCSFSSASIRESRLLLCCVKGRLSETPSGSGEQERAGEGGGEQAGSGGGGGGGSQLSVGGGGGCSEEEDGGEGGSGGCSR